MLTKQSLLPLAGSLSEQLYGEARAVQEVYLVTILLLTAIEHIQRVDTPELLTLSEEIIEEFEKKYTASCEK